MCMRKTPFPTQFYEDIHFEFYQIIYIDLKNQLQKAQENGNCIKTG